MYSKRHPLSDVFEAMGGPGSPRGGGPRHHAGRHGRHGGPDFGLGGFGPGFGRGGGRRAARGDVRAAALLLLAEEPRNGYALMQEIEQRSEGAWRPSPGSIYPVLQQLEDESLVRVQEGGSGRTFELTDEGRAHVEGHREELGEPWTTVGGGAPKEARELRRLLPQIAKAAAEIVHSGSDEQRAAAIAQLAETRRGLYRILAEDDPA
jgi:DNA-binding PadR family transcriptional regulator